MPYGQPDTDKKLHNAHGRAESNAQGGGGAKKITKTQRPEKEGRLALI
jgi:hypothetical protein